MAISRRKRRLEKKNQAEGKKILTIVLVSTAVILVLMYMIFSYS